MRARRSQICLLTSLKKRDDFLRARTEGRKWVSEGLILQAVARKVDAPALPPPAALRFGITVTKKTDKRAVVRNRIKRRLRAAAAESLPRAARTHDYVLIGRTETLTRPYDRLCRDITWCLGKMGLLADAPDGKPGPETPSETLS